MSLQRVADGNDDKPLVCLSVQGLKNLILTGSEVPEADVTKLRQALPNCKIELSQLARNIFIE